MRRGSAKKRVIVPDCRYNSVRIAKFINIAMLDGKKSKSSSIIYTSLENAAKKMHIEVRELFDKVLENTVPATEVRSKRVGGATYQVPVGIAGSRAATLAMRSLISSARKRSGLSMVDKLTNELMDAFNERGGAVKAKEDMHKMAESNRAFSHFAW